MATTERGEAIMAVMNTKSGWGWPARLIHWLSALLILGLLGVGFYMTQILAHETTCDSIVTRTLSNVYGISDCGPLFLRLEMVQTHKSFGFIVFTLVVLRLVWRAVNPTPSLDHMPGVMRALAHGGHIALYICIVAMPLTGWLMASSSPFNDEGNYGGQIKNMVFGLFEMPDPYPTGDEDTSDFWGMIHFYTALAMAAILATHIAAALKHHIIDRDGVLMRMVRG